MRINDITGLKFGKLMVIKQSGRTKRGAVLWLCKCDCGNEVTVRGTNLIQGQTKSCGCSRLDKIKKRRESGQYQIVPKIASNDFSCPNCGCNKHHAKGYCRNCYYKIRKEALK